MKKIVSIALFVAVFGLIGCSSQDKPSVTADRDYTVATADQRAKCKGKKCRVGKLGVEKQADDVAK